MTKEGNKILNVLSYLTLIGWIATLIIHNKHERQSTKHHLQQALLLHIASMLFYFIPPLRLANILTMIFLIIGITYAAQGKKKTIPLVGPVALDLFRNL